MQTADAIEARLKGLESAEWDEEKADDGSIIQLSRKKSKESAAKKAKKAAARGAKAPGSDVVYVGHIPHGFYELEMKTFFSQFGDVRRLRLSRSKRTGGSRGYAFVQFAEASVAKVVADTMDGYLLNEKKMVCELVPVEKQHAELWKGHKDKFININWRKREVERRNRQRTPEQEGRRRQRNQRSMRAKKRQLAALGIDYGFFRDEDDAEAATEEAAPEAAAAAPDGGAEPRGKRGGAKKAAAKRAAPAKSRPKRTRRG